MTAEELRQNIKYINLEADNGERVIFNVLPDWIPVSKRLPEEDGRYIVTKRDERDDEEIYVTTSYYQNDEYGFFSEEEIIAWMPLPEPYKGESEDKE